MRSQVFSTMSLGFIFQHRITFLPYFLRPGVIPTNKCHIEWCRSPSLRMYIPYFCSIISLSQPCLPFQTAIAVGTSYDTLAGLFECVANFIGRLRIYSEIPFEPTMSGLIIRIMVEMLSVLALATKQIRQGRLSTPLIS